MTRTISLIIGIATVALVVGVPTALGEGRLAGSLEPAPAVAPDWFERAATRAVDRDGGIVVSRPDSHDVVTDQSNGYADAAERAQRIDVVVPTALTDSFERSAPPAGVQPSGSSASASGGDDRDWSQLGTGFGIGLVLALGLFLTMRYTRGRELAH
jgi:hypothetical protein